MGIFLWYFCDQFLRVFLDLSIAKTIPAELVEASAPGECLLFLLLCFERSKNISPSSKS